MKQGEDRPGLLAQFRQPYVALLGVGGSAFCVLFALLVAAHDPKTALGIAAGFATAQIIKGASAFAGNAPNSGIAMFLCFGVGFLGSLAITIALVGMAAILTALGENGFAMMVGAFVGLYAALLGAAQDRPRHD